MQRKDEGGYKQRQYGQHNIPPPENIVFRLFMESD